jgi:hypothetical protein
MVQSVPIAAVAVKRPPEVIVPHFAVQFTGMEAVNCCVDPCGVVADTGVMTIGETTVISAVALPLPPVAVAVTTQPVLAYNDALYRPLDEIDPHVVVQLAVALAVSWYVAPSLTVAVVGVMENGVVDEEPGCSRMG